MMFISSAKSQKQVKYPDIFFGVFNTFALPNLLTMMISRFILIIVACSLLALPSCRNRADNGDLPADVVSNPNTASGKPDMSALPVISFEKDFHDFGKLRSGEKVTYSFKFRNTGKNLLVISSVTSSCGCTISDYPRQPIKPGESNTIDVSFDSEGRQGLQNKTVTVFSNTQPATSQLRIKAIVVRPEDI